ncbi:hypothetical protein HDU96_008281 [Phlyctochytrium bullatum]|nr:hypothetical protein HDU96_008281 [Phlyctochytrium bullatum]
MVHAGGPSDGKDCPPKDFTLAKNFNLNGFTGSWFLREAMPTDYYREDVMYCTRIKAIDDVLNAFISPISPVTRTSGKEFSYSYYSLVGSITGKVDVRFPQLSGSYSRDDEQAKMRIYPTGMEPSWGREHQVVLTSAFTAGKYEWVVTSGGPPRTKTANDLCVADGNSDLWTNNNQGLFIYTRTATSDLTPIRDAIKVAGLDPDVLMTVTHTGCTYSTSSVTLNFAGN